MYCIYVDPKTKALLRHAKMVQMSIKCQTKFKRTKKKAKIMKAHGVGWAQARVATLYKFV